MEMTIQELAARVGMTPRNIREWQTIGVLPAPERRGRVAFYDNDHLTRIERVKSLRADGFPLEVIRQFLERSEESANDVLTVASALLDPVNHSGTKSVSRGHLVELFGDGAVGRLAQSGMVDIVDDDEIVVKDTATFEYIEQLAAIGLPIDAVLSALDAMTRHQIEGVSALVDLYSGVVWQPFVDAGLPTEQWRSIAETSVRMHQLVIGVGTQLLRRATDSIIAEIAVQQANKLNSGRHT